MKMPHGYWQQSAQELARIHPRECGKGNRNYVNIRRNGETVLLHRWIWEELVGPILPNHEIDHINGIRTDCRLENLRLVKKIGNLRNRAKPANNTSGTTGVSQVKIKDAVYWVAHWKDPITGRQKFKYFSTKKLGEGNAKQNALDHRSMIMEDLRKNHGYTDRHGE